MSLLKSASPTMGRMLENLHSIRKQHRAVIIPALQVLLQKNGANVQNKT